MKPDIVGYPIFEVGTWNKQEFTEDDLDMIAATHADLVDGQKIHRVPLKIGHNDAQPLTDGMPALGWVQNVRRVGKRLLADFYNVPKVIKKCIARKMYTSVSIELMVGLKRGDKDYKYVLDAVAILGADHPAVHTLPDLDAYLASRSLGDEGGQRVVFNRRVEKVRFSQPRNQGGPAMDEETQKLIDSAVAAAIAPLRAEIKTLETQVADYKRKFSEEEDKRIKAETEAKNVKARFAEIEDAKKREQVATARAAVKAVYEEAVKAKVMTPAQRDADYRLNGIETDDERVLKLFADIEVLRVRLVGDKKPDDRGGSKTRMSREDESTAGGGTDDTNPDRVHKDVFQEMDRRIKIVMTRDHKKYGEALRVVAAEDPDLHAEYLSTTPPVRAVAGGER